METFTSLEQNVIENLKAVNLLSDVCNSSSESNPVHSNKLKAKRFSYEDLSNYISDPAKSEAVGGYSKVYRGKLDGMQVAIKVLENDKVAAKSFTAEIETMVVASHPNLVKLYGYCFESNMKALVYEFMENGSLDKILFENHLSLDWGKLYEITLDTAKGLAYLHDGCGKQIIHRDIKPANVLLDENLSAKITDFGVAKLLSMDAKHYTITHNQGTPGYIAPEFGNPTSQITNKCDVYSFGVTLFEIFGKRKNGDFGQEWFPLQVWKKFDKGKLDELMESIGIPEIHKGKAKILSMAGFWCLQFTVDMRPSMSNVVEVLEKEIPVNTPPYPFKENVPSPDITMLPSQESLAPDEQAPSNISEQALSKESKTNYFSMFFSYRRKKFSKTSSKTPKLLSELTTGQPHQFSCSDIKRFTSNFSFPMQIANGVYRDVYIGKFRDGVKVLIKVWRGSLRDEIFMKSVMMMGNVSFPQILKLCGYCFHSKLKALVYEYVENGSLDWILYENQHLDLEWEQLYKTVTETAKGLSALHAVGIIHHGINASNILLDSNFSPKIYCTGLHQFYDVDNTDLNTSLKIWIVGYSAPEKWIPTSVVTSKADVYSFGMLLFEVLGRRRNGLGEEWFPNQVWIMFNEGQLSKMIKDCGINDKDREQAYNLSMVALWCAQRDPEKRPSMSSVVKMLQMEIPVMDPPNPFLFGDYSTSSSLVGSPRFNQESSPSSELSFREKGYALTDSDGDRAWELESMLNSFEEKCPPGGENSVVLYTRTVGFLRRFSKCNNVRSILMSHQIEIFERDISVNSAYRVELKELLGRTEVPALFVHGRFIGGVNEVNSLEEEGKLKILLHGIPDGKTILSPEGNLSFHEKGYALTDSNDDSWDWGGQIFGTSSQTNTDDDRGMDEGRELHSTLNKFD